MFSSMLSLLGSLRGGSSFITNSLRFRSSASAYLSRTPSVAGNRQIFTWSGWLKRGIISSGTHTLFAARNSTTDWQALRINAGDQIEFLQETVGPTYRRTSAVYRDPSAHFHVVLSVNTTDATTQNRIRIYVNGVEITAWSVNQTVNQNTNFAINNTVAHTVGIDAGGGSYFDGYLTEVHFIDGQALTPASFGAIDSSTGVWAPRPYSGTYGTNGFYLKFANTSSVAALGNDSSGNNNTWTVNNVSLTAGATYDSMADVPVNYSDGGNGRGNYCTLNPLAIASPYTLSSANLSWSSTTSTAGSYYAKSTISVLSGKWYFEIIATDVGAGTNLGVGIQSSLVSALTGSSAGEVASGYVYYSAGTKVTSTTFSAYGASWTNADVIGVAFDADSGSLTFYKNNVSQGVAFTGITGEFVPLVWFYTGGGVTRTTAGSINFGQRPFTYTPPAGFRALNTNNLPTPSIVNGANFMAATTYTGNAAARSLSNAVNSVSFQPDLVWIKSRTPGATSHALFNSTRGTTKYLSSNTAGSETTNANTLTAFGADGFSLGTDTTLVNANANSYVAWQWRESITAGLDVVTYTGTLTGAGTVAINHNLGVAPSLVISKSLTPTGVDVGNWFVWHASAGTGNFLRLNTPDQAGSISSSGGGTMIAPTNSVFYTPYISGANASGNNYVAYCFAQIAGFSRFGSYTGNGSADGPFVFCGFRPRFIMVKRFDSSGGWNITDTSMAQFNMAQPLLQANTPATEAAAFEADILSNGFKYRGTSTNILFDHNISGATYIFAAFAEVPSKYALAR